MSSRTPLDKRAAVRYAVILLVATVQKRQGGVWVSAAEKVMSGWPSAGFFSVQAWGFKFLSEREAVIKRRRAVMCQLKAAAMQLECCAVHAHGMVEGHQTAKGGDS